MKRIILQYIPAWLLLMVMALIVVHAPLTVYVGWKHPELALGVKMWKEVLMALAAVLLVTDYTLARQWRAVMRDKLLLIAGAYIVLHLLTLLWLPQGLMASVAGLMIDLRYVVYMTLVYLFVRRYPVYRQSVLRVGLVGAIIVIGFAALQLALPRDILAQLGYSKATIAPYLTVDSNPDFVRYNSTLRGPNPLGAYAAMVIIGAVAYVAHLARTTRRWSRRLVGTLVLACLAVCALWISYSRSALVAGVVGCAVAAVVVLRIRWSKNVLLWMVVALVALVSSLSLIRDTSFYHNVIVHDNPTTGAAVDSNAGHIDSLRVGLGRLITEPLGRGVGSTGSASQFGAHPIIIENQWLFVAHEAGWLGLGLYIALHIVIVMRLWRGRQDWRMAAALASGLAMAAIGLLLPVWVDDTVAIVWWGVVGALLAKGAIDD